jgi:lipid-A-disaccharide synthase
LERAPSVVITIDSPGFCFSIAKIIRKKNPKIKLVHVVAPSVWAWRQKRAMKMAKIYDKLLTLFDFEPKYFLKYGLDTIFVGHPAVEKFHASNNDVKEDTLLLMPGSRSQEIKTLLPIFLDSINSIKAARIVIPTLKNLVPQIQSIIGVRKMEIVHDEAQKNELYKTAKLAIVASGTATLQLALSGCPMVVCYRLSNLTFSILKRMVKVKYISLVNIVLDRSAVPELIQCECNSNNIAKTTDIILTSGQINVTDEFRNKLITPTALPSEYITNIITDMLRENKATDYNVDRSFSSASTKDC